MENQASAASSSSAPSCPGYISYPHYDVFINHRGKDVKTTFAAELYRRLVEKGLQVFLDKPEMLPGQSIHKQIEEAIEISHVQVAIFSRGYAQSKWCMDELKLMLETTKRDINPATILPVFYNVEPSHLRSRAKGAYAEALSNHEKAGRYDSNTIESWRIALSSVPDTSGIVLDGDENELLRRVVQSVLENVPKVPFEVAGYPTGVEEKFQELEGKLQEFEMRMLKEHKEHKVPMRAKVVGIVGFGGIGKTTLAKLFFNRKRLHYKESSFLFEVRERAARKTLMYLQSKLLRDLKYNKGDHTEIYSIEEGKVLLKKHLENRRVLIIIDDVDDATQLEALVPVHDLKSESLILVTTRNKRVLKSGVSLVYNMTGLNTCELFCSHAFPQSLPPTEFAKLVDQFVEACCGLPLSLKVIGALLCGEDEQYWKCQLVRLRQTLPEEIQKRLRISYDSLCKEDQPIFLDIACFYLGGNKDRAIRIWDSVAIQNLENKCLLEVDSENKLRMHDHIRDCARSIAQEESMPLRLWYQTPTNVVDALLEKSSSGSDSVEIEVRGIATMPDAFKSDDFHRYHSDYMMKGSEIEHLFNNSDFRGMKNLHFVATNGSSLEAMLRRAPQLSWLRWYGCSCSSLPDWIPMKNLRVLEVQGNDMKSLWREQYQGPRELRELRIFNAPLSNIPKSIGQLRHLEWIHITAPPSFLMSKKSTLETLPEEFCRLHSLKHLVLEEFSKLISLPDSFGKLKKLQHISLGGASSLQRLLDSFGKLTNLQHISLQGASSLQRLPDSFGKLSNLQHINLKDAKSLQRLPDSFGKLSNLQHINLQRASSLQRLPDSFGKLSNLQHINLQWASSLQRLPDSFGKLSNLQHINLEGASSLQRLPDSFGKLTNLQHINLANAFSLQRLPNSFGNLTRLKHLDLRCCSKLTISNGALANIARLEYLSLNNCTNVRELPHQVAHQWSLKQLDLECTNLKELPCGIGDLCNLEILVIGNDSLELLPNSLGNLKSLKVFRLRFSPKVKCLPDSFGMLTQLRELELTASGIKYLPQDLPKFNNLETLLVRWGCPLREVSFLRGEGEAVISSLEGGSGCDKLDSANDKFMFGLKRLTLLGTQISEVAFFKGVCPNLEYLHVSECSELKSIQGLGQLTKLKCLNVSECSELKSIQGLGQLTKLRCLTVNRCSEIEELAGVEHCWSLMDLDARDCPKLRWGGGVLQQLRGRLKTGLHIDVKQKKRRKLCAYKRRKLCAYCLSLQYLDARGYPKLRWGGGVLQQLRGRLKKGLKYKRRKLCA